MAKKEKKEVKKEEKKLTRYIVRDQVIEAENIDEALKIYEQNI